MTKFNAYARRVDETAKAAFKQFRSAEHDFKKAQEQARKYPQRRGADARYTAQAARAQADLLEAKARLDAAKRSFRDSGKQFEALRKELAAAVEKEFSADPAKLDGNTLELLKSGILTGREYKQLLAKAKSDGNPTLARLIGKYAGSAAEERSKKFGVHDPDATDMRVTAEDSKSFTGNDRVEAFDYLTNLYSRCTVNPSMIDHWSEFADHVVENF